MEKNYILVTKYDTAGIQNDETDVLRKEFCLCLNCKNMVICPAAKAGFELCKKYGLAFMVTRCSVPRDPSKPAGHDNLLFEPKN